jgi:hypothetical protein
MITGFKRDMLPSEISMLMANKLGQKVELTSFNGSSGQVELDDHLLWDLVTFDITNSQLMLRHKSNGWTVTEHCNWWANLALYELSRLGFDRLTYLGMFGPNHSHFVYDDAGKVVHRVDFNTFNIEINTLS